jgi:hypothetical protein
LSSPAHSHVLCREHGILRFTFIALVALSIGCGKDTQTSPTTTTTDTTTQTAASPTTTEEFQSTVGVGGSKFYSFTTSTYGTIQLTLTAVSGNVVPPTVMLGLGLGQPSGTDCATTPTVNTAAGTTPQVTGLYAAGVYCAKVSDIGNLFGPASFDVTVAYP